VPDADAVGPSPLCGSDPDAAFEEVVTGGATGVTGSGVAGVAELVPGVGSVWRAVGRLGAREALPVDPERDAEVSPELPALVPDAAPPPAESPESVTSSAAVVLSSPGRCRGMCGRSPSNVLYETTRVRAESASDIIPSRGRGSQSQPKATIRPTTRTPIEVSTAR
jgi:hypothetical protein